jgi:hypothetical protein
MTIKNEAILAYLQAEQRHSVPLLLEKAKIPSLQIRRQRTMALETFKIINQLTPVCLQNLE